MGTYYQKCKQYIKQVIAENPDERYYAWFACCKTQEEIPAVWEAYLCAGYTEVSLIERIMA